MNLYERTWFCYADDDWIVGQLEYSIHKCDINGFRKLYNSGERLDSYDTAYEALELLLTASRITKHNKNKLIDMYEFLLNHEFFKNIKPYSTDIDEPSVLTMIRNHEPYSCVADILFEYIIEKFPEVIDLKYGPDKDPFLLFMAKGNYMKISRGWITYPGKNVDHYNKKNKHDQSLRDVVLMENNNWRGSYNPYKQNFIDFLINQEYQYQSLVKIQRWAIKMLYNPTSSYILRMVEDWQNE